MAFATHDLPLHLFPFRMFFFNAEWQIVGEERIDGPGAYHVPSFDEPVGNQTIFANGEIVVQVPPPRDVWERSKQDPNVFHEWVRSRCDHDDELNRIGSCPLDRGHAGACEIKFFIPGSPNYVGRVTFNDRPIKDTPPL